MADRELIECTPAIHNPVNLVIRGNQDTQVVQVEFTPVIMDTRCRSKVVHRCLHQARS
jgi:hypothetical protein